MNHPIIIVSSQHANCNDSGRVCEVDHAAPFMVFIIVSLLR